MSSVDVIAAIVVACVVAWGAWAGFGRALPVAAFAGGFLAGAALVPQLLDDGRDDTFAFAIAIPAGLIAGALVATVVERIALRWDRRIERMPRSLSVIGGGLFAAGAGLVLVWFAGAVALQIGGLDDRLDESDFIAKAEGIVPIPGNAAGESEPTDPLPFVAIGGGPEIAPPNRTLVNSAGVKRADRSVVRVNVMGCESGHGSGWIAADGIVVTNAHVTNAADEIKVKLRGSDKEHEAEAIWYDPRNDLSLLRVDGVKGKRALQMVQRPKAGTSGALIGFPEGLHAIRPARVGRTTTKLRMELAEQRPKGFPDGPTGTLTTPFRGRAEAGNSGGPVVDGEGRVLTTAYAGDDHRAFGIGVPNSVVRSALRRADNKVKLGECEARLLDDERQ